MSASERLRTRWRKLGVRMSSFSTSSLARRSAFSAASSTGPTYMNADSGRFSALAAPGGYIFVTKGLYRLLRDESELAGVLALIRDS